jgi:hypothetical protein
MHCPVNTIIYDFTSRIDRGINCPAFVISKTVRHCPSIILILQFYLTQDILQTLGRGSVALIVFFVIVNTSDNAFTRVTISDYYRSVFGLRRLIVHFSGLLIASEAYLLCPIKA